MDILHLIGGICLAFMSIAAIILGFSALLPSIYHRSEHGRHITVGMAARSYREDWNKRRRAQRDREIWQEYDESQK